MKGNIFPSADPSGSFVIVSQTSDCRNETLLISILELVFIGQIHAYTFTIKKRIINLNQTIM